MHIEQLINKLRTVSLMLNESLENTLPRDRLIKHTLIYHTRLFRVLKLPRRYLIVLVKYPARIVHEHEVE
jgi:hypothetical protein